MEGTKCDYRILAGRPHEKLMIGIPRRWEDIIKMDLRESD